MVDAVCVIVAQPHSDSMTAAPSVGVFAATHPGSLYHDAQVPAVAHRSSRLLRHQTK